MLPASVFILAAGCLIPASYGDFIFQPPDIVPVSRSWYAYPTDPVGTVVTRINRERKGNETIKYSLASNGPQIPFAIDPNTGIVTVNDTLADKEKKEYLIWVIIDDGFLPQKTEVLATVTDKNGTRPKLPSIHPYLPDFPSIKPNIRFPPELFPASKPSTTSTSSPTTKPAPKIPQEIPKTEETLNQPKTPDDVPTPPVDKAVESNNLGEGDKITINATTAEVKSDVVLVVIPIVVISGLVVIVAAVIIFVCKKNNEDPKEKTKDDMSKDSNGIVLQDASLNIWDRPRAYSNRYECWDSNHLQMTEETSVTTKEEPKDEWEFPRHRLRIFNIVGEGAFGQVWRAQAVDIDGKKGEQTVAVKTLKENASEKEKSDLIQELIVMKGLGTHPNVVRLVGCCTDKEPTLVIMEFVSLGKLQQYLRDSRAERHYGNTHAGSQFLTSRDLTHFAFQVARGMEFLSSKGIIHRDLAARNVLINDERTCKVADFGFARDVTGKHVYERKSDGRLPIRWMAPESLYDDIFSVKSDIWSFGVLLWEIVTLGSTPYPGLSAGDVMKKVRSGHRLEKPEHCRRELYNIMYYCWEAEAAARPDFIECVGLLEKLLCTETDYIELERFPDHTYYNVQHLDGEKL